MLRLYGLEFELQWTGLTIAALPLPPLSGPLQSMCSPCTLWALPARRHGCSRKCPDLLSGTSGRHAKCSKTHLWRASSCHR